MISLLKSAQYKIVLITVLIVLGLGAGWSHAQQSGISARVDYAKSGHTLELLSELSFQIPVLNIRLAGVQAPDLRQEPWGKDARECLSDLSEELVHIEPQRSTPDNYSRLWAYVWHGQELVNARVLAQGCAFLDGDRISQQRYSNRLIYAQEEARLLGRGIWNPDRPLRQTPASFRQGAESP